MFSGRSVGRAFTEPPIFHPHGLVHVLISRSLARSLLCAPLTRALWATASDLDAFRRGQVSHVGGVLIFKQTCRSTGILAMLVPKIQIFFF